jgi:hypothetical protein
MLAYLARTYFHEDFDIEAESPLGVVEKFAIRERAEYSRELLGELNSLRDRGVSEEQAKRIWLDECGAYYEPDSDGINYVQWFEQIIDLLERRLRSI